ncbi:Domain of unknown function DUF551 [uncultured Caudovirales phage]|uniref:DUF551 domain-containing protein n=1 Tax=uncultured Caudovirales phage TaxID=2100421 RepID=A0A6J5KW80_9CAUD|nr:Domain of unknown function DUF551 [uncultured Caudovirales phage]
MEWINVKDRLPSNYKRILIYGICTCGRCHKYKEVFEVHIDYYHKQYVYGEYDCSVEYEYWMLLPEPPNTSANPQNSCIQDKPSDSEQTSSAQPFDMHPLC